jgi:hypothetical protein
MALEAEEAEFILKDGTSVFARELLPSDSTALGSLP